MAPAIDHGEQISPQEFGGVISPVALAGANRLAHEVPAQIVRQSFDRRVAPIRFLAHGHRDDRIQVAAQAGAQALRRESAPIRDAAAIKIALALQLGDDDLTGTSRIVHANGPLQLQLAIAQQAIRRAARQRLVEQYAERIDVRRGRDRASEDLLGRGVLRREYAFLQSGDGQRMRETFRRKQLGNAKIEKLRRTLVGDEDIRRLDITVHHQVAVCVVHRPAHGDE